MIRLLFFASALMPLLLLGQIRQIAITIDDAPLGEGPFFSGERRGQMLIQRLQQAGVTQAMFFVVTGHMDEEGIKRLQNYAEAGHKLGNHTHMHPSANRTDAASYLQDVALADSILRPMKGMVPYFRYPYLHEGADSLRRDSIRAGIQKLGYANGYVTVDNSDWYIHALTREAKDAGQKINTTLLRQWWVDHLWRGIQFYDSVAVASLGRSPKHVLLLHENDLTGLFLPDLIRKLDMEGWTIIEATQAYSDAIAQYVPETLFLGQGRVAAIAADKGSAPKDLVPPWEDEEYLREEAKRLGVFVDP